MESLSSWEKAPPIHTTHLLDWLVSVVHMWCTLLSLVHFTVLGRSGWIQVRGSMWIQNVSKLCNQNWTARLSCRHSNYFWHMEGDQIWIRRWEYKLRCRLCPKLCQWVCLFNWQPRAETHLGPDGTRLKQNAQARLKACWPSGSMEIQRERNRSEHKRWRKRNPKPNNFTVSLWTKRKENF